MKIENIFEIAVKAIRPKVRIGGNLDQLSCDANPVSGFSDTSLKNITNAKGGKDRNVMLSPSLLDLLRTWWKAARPQGWLFPGRDPAQPMTTRQLNRACRAAAQMAEINKRVSLHTLRHSFATHLLEQNVDVRVIQVLLGHAKLDTTALYTRVATKTISEVMSPLEHIALKLKEVRPSG